MHTNAVPDELAGDDGGVIEREVETVRVREHVGPDGTLPEAHATLGDRRTGYFELLPERLKAVGAVVRTAIVGLLGIRFLLLASGANTSSSFGAFVEDVSWLFERPFSNIFRDLSLGPMVIEPSAIVAMVVYFLMFALLGMLVTALVPRLSSNPLQRHAPTPQMKTPPADATSEAVHAEPRRGHPLSTTGGVRKHRYLLRVARARKD